MEKELKFCTGVLLRADLTGHSHPNLFWQMGLDGRALLGQPSKPTRAGFYFFPIIPDDVHNNQNSNSQWTEFISSDLQILNTFSCGVGINGSL